MKEPLTFLKPGSFALSTGPGTLLGIHWSIWTTVLLGSSAGGAALGYLGGRNRKTALYAGLGGAAGSALALAILGVYEISNAPKPPAE